VFHIDWNDIQLLATDGTFNFNANGGGAKSDGVEFTATAAPAPGLDLSANAAYTNARLTTDTLIGGLDGDKLPFTPEFTASLNGDYSFPVGNDVERTSAARCATCPTSRRASTGTIARRTASSGRSTTTR
jgi:outer membrane receptor protein involved in Fe transport